MPKAKCPTCATIVTYKAGYNPICPSCGFRGAAPEPPAAKGATTATVLQPLSAVPVAPAQQGLNQGMPVAALVLGIIAIIVVWVPVLGALLGILAAIFGGLGMTNADRDPQRFGGKGLAVAGLVLGLIAAAFGILFWVAIVNILESF